MYEEGPSRRPPRDVRVRLAVPPRLAARPSSRARRPLARVPDRRSALAHHAPTPGHRARQPETRVRRRAIARRIESPRATFLRTPRDDDRRELRLLLSAAVGAALPCRYGQPRARRGGYRARTGRPCPHRPLRQLGAPG